MSETTAETPESARGASLGKRLVGGALLLLFFLYSITEEVQFYESAVVTTFGKPSAESVINADGKGAGLYFKMPLVQQYRKYDRRVQVIEDRLEEQQTADRQTIIVSAYLAWRVQDPLKFFNMLRTPEKAEDSLRTRLRAARSQLAEFNFDELVSVSDASGETPGLKKAESKITQAIRDNVDKLGYGVEIVSVGVRRITLSTAVTEKVFERMIQTRRRMAQAARSEGDAAANDIKARAESDAQRILAFADRRAGQIRARGDEAAAEYFATFKTNEDFAIFLRKLEALKKTLKNRSTFVIDTGTVPFDLFAEELDRRMKQAKKARDEKAGAGSGK